MDMTHFFSATAILEPGVHLFENPNFHQLFMRWNLINFLISAEASSRNWRMELVDAKG